MKPYLITKDANGLLQFTINKIEKRNAICYNVMDGLLEAIELAGDEDVKALAITGAGEQAFCSGGDLSVFHELRTEEEAYGMLSKMSEILYKLLLLPKPTVAILNGTAVGGGCELAVACDYRIGSQGVKAGFVQGKLAITTGWGGGTILFEKLSPSNALKMLTEAQVYTADELQRLGFLDEIYTGSKDNACQAFLEKSLTLGTSVLSAYKTMLVQKWKVHEIKERIDEEVKNCSILWASDLHHSKVDEFRNGK
ncbi:enoyl-CoA hydratase/isomerase family protein [Mesobacillus harenae]|uniref:enoyl-CoA hydratase/isomerase family protein n=1 Tax=Mesobacillus harenae TaxID=2213203 RepID=UPI001580956B|nr:enoyl-CoA hydratase/isomerase family protein [Mesobacillus harenae]